MKNKFITIILAAISFFAFSSSAFAGTATLNWNANTEPDLAGYKVYYDLVSRTGTTPCANAGYASSINVGNVTTYAFNNLTDGVTYYFAISAFDTTGNESTCSAQQSKVIPPTDTTLPTITAFTIPTTSSSLTVSVSSFTASDNTGVTGYKLTESATPPLASDSGWSSTAPTSYTFATQGTKTLYAWAKDAAGNVSTSVSGAVTVTLATQSTCSSWTYSDWSACQSNSTQSRTVTTSAPSGCTGGSPVTSQSCAYTAPTSGGGGGGGGYIPPTTSTIPPTALTTSTPSTISNPSAVATLNPVVIRNLKIVKDTDKLPITEGQTIAGTTVLFEALAFDTDNNKVRIEVEIRKSTEAFTGTPTAMSDFVPSGSTLQFKNTTLVSGTYKIRARTKAQSTSATSDWLDFGSKDIADFTIAPAKTATLPSVKGPFSLTTVSSEVMLLKLTLTALGFPVTNTTNQYDKETTVAVTAFQKIHNLAQVGIAGPQTRTKLNAEYKKLAGTPTSSGSTLVSNLRKGSRSEEVKILQTILAQDPAIYPEQSITGYFGPATERAVIRFQKKYNITPAVGFVGAVTRARLNGR